jgi:hypothetical protein
VSPASSTATESTVRAIACWSALAVLPILNIPARAQTAVLTRSYDNGRTGANTSETILRPAFLETKRLHLLKSLRVDDDPPIEAQPLYVPGLKLSDGTTRDISSRSAVAVLERQRLNCWVRFGGVKDCGAFAAVDLLAPGVLIIGWAIPESRKTGESPRNTASALPRS